MEGNKRKRLWIATFLMLLFRLIFRSFPDVFTAERIMVLCVDLVLFLGINEYLKK